MIIVVCISWLVILVLAVWLFHALKTASLSPIKPDETKLNSAFDAIQAKEKATSDANLTRFDSEDRMYLLDDLNRKPRV